MRRKAACVSIFLSLYLSILTVIPAQTLSFQTGSKSVQAYLVSPPHPKAIILYFHRAVETRDTVLEWGNLLKTNGYAIAGYTSIDDLAEPQTARALLAAVRNKFPGTPL